MDDKDRGLYAKYRVTKADGTPLDGDCFVLRPDRDPAARCALKEYAYQTPNGELSADIEEWLDRIGEVDYTTREATQMMDASDEYELAAYRAENERLCAALKLAQVRAADYDADIEAGRMLRLPAAIGQLVYVPSGDGGVYTARVKGIGVLRPDAHDAIMRATVRVGLENETLEYLIAPENKGTHWFETDVEARAALGKECQ